MKNNRIFLFATPPLCGLFLGVAACQPKSAGDGVGGSETRITNLLLEGNKSLTEVSKAVTELKQHLKESQEGQLKVGAELAAMAEQLNGIEQKALAKAPVETPAKSVSAKGSLVDQALLDRLAGLERENDGAGQIQLLVRANGTAEITITGTNGVKRTALRKQATGQWVGGDAPSSRPVPKDPEGQLIPLEEGTPPPPPAGKKPPPAEDGVLKVLE